MAEPYKPNDDVIAAFWSRVTVRGEHDCWDWTGAVNGNGKDSGGYGNFRGMLAHRLAYELHHGPEAIEANPKHYVCHLCKDFVPGLKEDNRLCCNWRHLMLGPNKANRYPNRVRRTKSSISLTPAQVETALDMMFSGDGQHYEAVHDVMRGATPLTEFPHSSVFWRIARGETYKKTRARVLNRLGLTEAEAAAIYNSLRRKR